jgi:hypothetical protein
MQVILDLVHKLLGVDVVAWIGAITALLSALIAVALMIPGAQPEKALQKLLDLLSKLSKK